MNIFPKHLESAFYIVSNLQDYKDSMKKVQSMKSITKHEKSTKTGQKHINKNCNPS